MSVVSNDPFGNPFATGSIAKPQHVASNKAIGTGRTPPVTAQALPPRPVNTASAAPMVSHETTGSIEAPHTGGGVTVGGWSSAGGASVVVAQGESADMLAKRYGVPQNVLLQVQWPEDRQRIAAGRHESSSRSIMRLQPPVRRLLRRASLPSSRRIWLLPRRGSSWRPVRSSAGRSCPRMWRRLKPDMKRPRRLRRSRPSAR